MFVCVCVFVCVCMYVRLHYGLLVFVFVCWLVGWPCVCVSVCVCVGATQFECQVWFDLPLYRHAILQSIRYTQANTSLSMPHMCVRACRCKCVCVCVFV